MRITLYSICNRNYVRGTAESDKAPEALRHSTVCAAVLTRVSHSTGMNDQAAPITLFRESAFA
jgi:hypothetical protein